MHELPLWLTGEREPKTYVTEPSDDDASCSRAQGSVKQDDARAKKDDEVKVEFVPDRLIAQLKDLKIAENAASDEEREDDEDRIKVVRDQSDYHRYGRCYLEAK